MTEQQGTRIAITVRPWVGEYELDLKRQWSTREWNLIKEVGGYMPFTIDEGIRGGDPSLVLALAVIAMMRNGKIDRDDARRVADDLLDVPYDGVAIRLIIEADEDDAGPPELTSVPDERSDNGTRSKSSTSGSRSKQSSGLSDENPSPIGISGSVSPDTSARTRSVKSPPQT